MKTKHPSFPTEFECFAFQKYMHQMPKKIFNGGMAKFLKKSFNTSIYVGYLFLLYCWVLRRVNMILIKQIGTRNVPVNFSGMLMECLFYCFSGQIVPPRRRNKSSAASSFSSIQTTGWVEVSITLHTSVYFIIKATLYTLLYDMT